MDVVVCLRLHGVTSDPLHQASPRLRKRLSKCASPCATPIAALSPAHEPQKILTQGSIAAAAPAASFKSRYRKCLGTSMAPTRPRCAI